jgi:hypothetical protein
MRSAAMAHLLCAARPPRRGGSGSGRSRYQYDTPITGLRKAIEDRTGIAEHAPASIESNEDAANFSSPLITKNCAGANSARNAAVKKRSATECGDECQAARPGIV